MFMFSLPKIQAILFCGVQAQLISVTNQDNENKLSVATNAVFFGGLIFSVFTAMLATCKFGRDFCSNKLSILLFYIVSGRWFSILREDDADYLSSRWLAQDCAEEGKVPKLEEYLVFQIKELETKRAEEGGLLCACKVCLTDVLKCSRKSEQKEKLNN